MNWAQCTQCGWGIETPNSQAQWVDDQGKWCPFCQTGMIVIDEDWDVSSLTPYPDHLSLKNLCWKLVEKFRECKKTHDFSPEIHEIYLISDKIEDELITLQNQAIDFLTMETELLRMYDDEYIDANPGVNRKE